MYIFLVIKQNPILLDLCIIRQRLLRQLDVYLNKPIETLIHRDVPRLKMVIQFGLNKYNII